VHHDDGLGDAEPKPARWADLRDRLACDPSKDFSTVGPRLLISAIIGAGVGTIVRGNFLSPKTCLFQSSPFAVHLTSPWPGFCLEAVRHFFRSCRDLIKQATRHHAITTIVTFHPDRLDLLLGVVFLGVSGGVCWSIC